ncbi:(2Fe-2S)-binding protein [Halothiobacillus diazotrophicus]|uniref:(2Fe-2S)-binding protein n=1 Tax=Halothiobacillus diazotrophicus TaxID=1860122 RepID=A0A191ZHF8_9GAMM|nr:(2Fe-2S)-binding protein [Halothiobacillus diazotrophicus]
MAKRPLAPCCPRRAMFHSLNQMLPDAAAGACDVIELTVNDRKLQLDVSEQMPLLWALRDYLGLTGTKFGCGAGLCGACTVHLDGKAVRSCVTPIASAKGKRVTTIEGLSAVSDHPVQLAWIAEDVPQCGYCQSGQIMQAAALLAEMPNPSDAQIDQAMAGNICRCGTYNRIKSAILRAAGNPNQNMALNAGAAVDSGLAQEATEVQS